MEENVWGLFCNSLIERKKEIKTLLNIINKNPILFMLIKLNKFNKA
jgi:hypothetical protein